MARAYVLMTAMPPTKGHLNLIRFAAQLGTSAEVIVSTQPSEPYWRERLEAVREATRTMNVNVHHIHEELPQEPAVANGFWDMWLEFLRRFGLQPGDYIVASELYGKKLAEISGAIFMPYDIDRSIYRCNATEVRLHPRQNFAEILPEFQPHMKLTVTVFGAESTGKTTLSKALAQRVNGWWLPEYARPYLETVGTEITDDAMTRIWGGQRALQEHAQHWMRDRPFTIQDTDLYSTIGYWDHWDMGTPDQLRQDADILRSDLYLITRSNIPFERDPLRYGGDHREMDDSHWIGFANRRSLPYKIIQAESPTERLVQAQTYVEELYDQRFTFTYQRRGQ